MYLSIRVLLIIGCNLPFSSAEAVRSFSGLRRIKSYLRNRMSDERLSGLALMHLHYDLDIDVDKICTIFVTKRGGCSKGASCRIQENGKRPRNYNVQPQLVGGVWGRSNLPQKSPTVLSEPKFGLPPPPPPPFNQKRPDPPLVWCYIVPHAAISYPIFLYRNQCGAIS